MTQIDTPLSNIGSYIRFADLMSRAVEAFLDVEDAIMFSDDNKFYIADMSKYINHESIYRPKEYRRLNLDDLNSIRKSAQEVPDGSVLMQCYNLDSLIGKEINGAIKVVGQDSSRVSLMYSLDFAGFASEIVVTSKVKDEARGELTLLFNPAELENILDTIRKNRANNKPKSKGRPVKIKWSYIYKKIDAYLDTGRKAGEKVHQSIIDDYAAAYPNFHCPELSTMDTKFTERRKERAKLIRRKKST